METLAQNPEYPGGWRFRLDQGGTFTDCLGLSPAGEIRLAKVLSTPLAPLAGIRKILQLREDETIPPSEIRLGTTLATNALLERRGRRHALLVTSGFADALEIGTQQRPDLFSLRIEMPPVLYSAVCEAHGRMDTAGRKSSLWTWTGWIRILLAWRRKATGTWRWCYCMGMPSRPTNAWPRRGRGERVSNASPAPMR